LNEEKAKNIVEILSKDWAERYQSEHGRGPTAAKSLLHNAQAGLNFVLRNSFARAGGEQAGYGRIATQALGKSVRIIGAYDKFIQLTDAPEAVWSKFIQVCNQEGIGINQKINEGVVKGIMKLAQNSVHHNPFEHIGRRVVPNTVDAFLLLRNISGIGDKVASFITRDIVTILDVEDKVAAQNQILLQPIDRWIHGVAILLWKELEGRAPPWLIALKVVTKCKEYECSPARFNQGAWMYGSSVIKDTSRISDIAFERVLNSER